MPTKRVVFNDYFQTFQLNPLIVRITLTSPFGWRPSTGTNHQGIDYVGLNSAGVTLKELSAPFCFPNFDTGETFQVEVIGRGTDGSRGNYVIGKYPDVTLQGNRKLVVAVYHLLQPASVGLGMTDTNQLAGYMGNTGNSFGDHIHLGTRPDNSANAWVNPIGLEIAYQGGYVSPQQGNIVKMNPALHSILYMKRRRER